MAAVLKKRALAEYSTQVVSNVTNIIFHNVNIKNLTEYFVFNSWNNNRQ